MFLHLLKWLLILRVIGLNSVGMKRNNINEESISLMKKAYKLLYRKNLKIDEAIKKIKELHSESNDSYLETFISSIEVSERGILDKVTQNKSLNIGVVCGEHSGDTLGAGIIQEIKKYSNVNLFGVGGLNLKS